MPHTSSTGPLHGMKVVEVGVAMAGPFCGMTLADYGADVVKVERVGTGDASRRWPPYFRNDTSYYFAAANRNKRSLAVDLKRPEGLEIVRALALDADILIDNFRSGALDRLGLGYEQLSGENPRLIYCSVTGFGSTGPRRDQRANDIFMQAYSGGMSITGEPDRGPSKMGISVADIGAGMFGVIGILLALQRRHETGRGQRVDTSLLEGQMAMLSYHLTYYFATGHAPIRKGGSGQVNVPYQAFRGQDDWFVVAAFTERMWQGVCTAIDKPEWAADPRFCDADQRSENRDELVQLLSDVFSTRPVDEWEERLGAQGVPCTRVNTIDRAVVEDQVKARNMVVGIEHPTAGAIKMAGLPIKLSETPGDIRSAPPLLGQHTADVLMALGYTKEQIDRYIAAGVIGVG